MKCFGHYCVLIILRKPVDRPKDPEPTVVDIENANEVYPPGHNTYEESPELPLKGDDMYDSCLDIDKVGREKHEGVV